MFDLDAIEKDWLSNSFKLSEEEIIEIYRSEGVTAKFFFKEIEEYQKEIHMNTAEERLLKAIFGELEEESYEKREFPTKKRLSENKQKLVVEGSLDIVFESTRYWYNYFEENISLERLYYVCLEALINSVKYALHCEKPVFYLYVSKSIDRNIIKYVSRWEHLTYREVYQIINNLEDYEDNGSLSSTKLHFNYENTDIIEKPSKIYYRIKDQSYDVDYIKDISSIEFMRDYYFALDNLDEDERIVMQLSYDANGNRGLTYNEISEYLGFDYNKISITKRNAIKKLRKNLKLNKYNT